MWEGSKSNTWEGDGMVRLWKGHASTEDSRSNGDSLHPKPLRERSYVYSSV